MDSLFNSYDNENNCNTQTVFTGSCYGRTWTEKTYQ